MAHERDVDAVSKQLQVLKGEYTKLFGGANFIGVGDVHQIPPVVQYASDEQVVAASVVSWPGWKALWKVELQHAHRDGGDARHSRFVDRCGTGQLSQANTTEDCTGLVKLDGLRTVDDLDQLIDFVYPTPGSLEDHERAILSCKNESVDDINERVCSRLPGEWVECLSSDEVDGEDARDPLHMRGEDFLRTVSAWSFFARRLHGLTRMPLSVQLDTPGKVPPHRLRLKVNAKIMILRNLSPKDRLVNGTTAIVRAIKTTWLRVETADGLHHVIPRINFKIDSRREYGSGATVNAGLLRVIGKKTACNIAMWHAVSSGEQTSKPTTLCLNACTTLFVSIQLLATSSLSRRVTPT